MRDLFTADIGGLQWTALFRATTSGKWCPTSLIQPILFFFFSPEEARATPGILDNVKTVCHVFCFLQ